MFLEVINDKSAARHDLEVVGTDLLKRAMHQLRSDAAATKRRRRFSVGDNDFAGCKPVIRKAIAPFTSNS